MEWLLALVGLALLALIHEGVRRLAAKKWRHAIANLLGALAHYVALVLLAFAFYVLYGMGTGELATRVEKVMSAFPAHGVLERGDRILAVDGRPLEYTRLADRVNEAGGRAVVLTIERDGARGDVTVQPRASDGKWLLGVMVQRREILHHDPGVAARWAWKVPVVVLRQAVREIRQALAGTDEPDAGGPKRIAEEFTIKLPLWLAAFSLLLRSALVALFLQLAINIVRSRRR